MTVMCSLLYMIHLVVVLYTKNNHIGRYNRWRVFIETIIITARLGAHTKRVSECEVVRVRCHILSQGIFLYAHVFTLRWENSLQGYDNAPTACFLLPVMLHHSL